MDTGSVALSATQHVYDGGRLRAHQRAAVAAAEAARLNYKLTVLTALQEVEDALVRVQQDQVAHASLVAAAKDAHTALHQSAMLYDAGLSGFLSVLIDERTEFAARDAVAVSDLTLVEDYIALFKALAGGWQAVDLDGATAAGPTLPAILPH